MFLSKLKTIGTLDPDPNWAKFQDLDTNSMYLDPHYCGIPRYRYLFHLVLPEELVIAVPLLLLLSVKLGPVRLTDQGLEPPLQRLPILLLRGFLSPMLSSSFPTQQKSKLRDHFLDLGGDSLHSTLRV